MRAQGRSVGPDSLPLRVWATWVLTQARSFCDAAARSTFQPATVCRITRNTLPRPRTRKRSSPRRFFKPLLVDSIPERGAYRSWNTSVCSSTRRAANRRPLSVNSRVNLPSFVVSIGHRCRNGHSAQADAGISTRVLAVAASCAHDVGRWPAGQASIVPVRSSHAKSSTVSVAGSASGARPGTGPTRSTPRASAAWTFSSPV